MSYTIKYFKFTSFENNILSFEEDSNGSLPSVEWTDPNGNLLRVIVSNFYPDLLNRNFSIKCLKYVKSNGRDKWAFEEEYSFTSDDNRYINAQTGEDCTIDHPEAIKSAQFFINNIGKNLYNVPLSLYSFFIKEILKKEGINA